MQSRFFFYFCYSDLDRFVQNLWHVKFIVYLTELQEFLCNKVEKLQYFKIYFPNNI